MSGCWVKDAFSLKFDFFIACTVSKLLMKRESPFSRSMHSWHSRRSANIGNNFPFLLGRQTYFLSWSICFSNCWTALNGLKKKQPHILQLPKVLGSLGFLPLARQVLSFFFNSTHTTDFFSFFFSFFQKKKTATFCRWSGSNCNAFYYHCILLSVKWVTKCINFTKRVELSMDFLQLNGKLTVGFLLPHMPLKLVRFAPCKEQFGGGKKTTVLQSSHVLLKL